jgi:protein associated with RNAse G/E
MPSDVVRVVYTKYDGSRHRDYPARRLAEDDLGTWLGVPAGTESVYHGRPSVERIPFVLLVPHSAWWTAMFNPPPRTSEVYCDIATPARWQGDGEVALVDLDLDVVRRRNTGLVQLLDEDEFAVHRESFGYPEELVADARGAAAYLVGALGNGTEPFASAYKKWLSLVV